MFPAPSVRAMVSSKGWVMPGVPAVPKNSAHRDHRNAAEVPTEISVSIVAAPCLAVAKNGKPVRNLQPYLGAYGHLVALRSGDLAYLHVHPNGEPGDGRTKPGPEVSFTATAPSAGAYRLFLDFQHEGTVRTAAFTVHAGGAADESEQPSRSRSAEEEEETGHTH
ncbi:hypothetical protein SVIOM74S_01565 [Streptomyces violarus]